MTPLPNRTRTSPSIPRRLLREGKLHLLPLYALMRTSDLGREGIDHSGSFRFADHVYRAEPSGRYGIGWLLDALLLRLRGARAMRSRFLHARAEIVRAALESPAGRDFRVLSVPCGIARELAGAAAALAAADSARHARAVFVGLDADPEPLALSRALRPGGEVLRLVRGDALDPTHYPPALDVIVSTGFGEFLPDEALVRFYAICCGALRDGGRLVTSCMRRDRVADWLMRELAELRAYYREGDAVAAMLERAGFANVVVRRDATGLQSLIVARKGAAASGAGTTLPGRC